MKSNYDEPAEIASRSRPSSSILRRLFLRPPPTSPSPPSELPAPHHIQSSFCPSPPHPCPPPDDPFLRFTIDGVHKSIAADATPTSIVPPPAGQDTLLALLHGDWLPSDAGLCRTPSHRLAWLCSHIIAPDDDIRTPFGLRTFIYADHTASGRPLRFVEDFMQLHVLRFYGNTHTEDSFVGGATSRMTRLSEEYVKRQLGGAADDVLLFCGSGTTAAIKRLQEVMGIAISPLLRRHLLKGLDCLTSPDDIDIPRWVVFTGPYEHHSNLLSWRQSLAEVVEISPDAHGRLNMEDLERALQAYSCRKPAARLLGAFSACSNVTGILTDTTAITELMHRYGGQVFFDFAAAAPHRAVNFGGGGYDAVALSPHKLAGGPGTPGILLMRPSLYALSGSAPSTAGGGTVSYVNSNSEDDTLYYKNIEVREDAGTPQILGKIRCALTFWVQQFVGIDVIHCLESSYIKKATARLSNHPNIKILGHFTSDVEQASVLSFIIIPTISNINKVAESKKPLHGRFVVRLLNDMFGIQTRGGCACAGPYGHFLLDIDKETSLRIREYIMKGYEGLKPGWTRVSFCYDMTEAEVNYILSSIEWVAHYGHLLLYLYDFDWKTGNWTTIQSLRNFESNVLTADEYIRNHNFEHMKNRLRLRKPLQLANALSHTLLKNPSVREIPGHIDCEVVLFHF